MVKNVIKGLICLLLISLVFNDSITYGVSGKTLSELLVELDGLEEKYTNLIDEKKLTEERLNEITNNLVSIGLEINNIENTIIFIQKDISELKDDIEKKKEQIRNLASVLQKNNGDENLYLEFIFGAETLTDFIYRRQIIERITEYNDNMIKEYSAKIDLLNQKDKNMKEQKDKLQVENEKLLVEQEELGSKINILDEDARDMLEEIADAKRVINNYQKMGCGLNDLLENCSVIPADSDFLRPLMSGVVTSGYGTRVNPVGSGYQFHHAVDIGGNPMGTSVYATASGVVVLAYNVSNPNEANSSCGGNHVIIQHKIGNIYYASRYMHLHNIYVTEGQKVTANDIIGAVGGGEIYDRCSTGPHLDFALAGGIYGQDFYSFRQPYTINPYTLVNLPGVGVYFTNRYQKF